MTTSTQNNHKHDNAQANNPKSTIKNVDSYEEKAKHTSCSENAAASKTATEVETVRKSLKSSMSANNFDAKLKNGIRSGEVLSKKNIDKDNVQCHFTDNVEGNLDLYGDSNLNAKTKDKSPMTSYTSVSVVRSLNSPIHHKSLSNSNKINKDVPNYPIPLDTPLPPTIPIGGYNENNDPVSINTWKSIQNEIELNDNEERKPLFYNEKECSKSAVTKLSCQEEAVPDTTSVWEKSGNSCTLQINSMKVVSDNSAAQQPNLHSTELKDVGVSPAPSRITDIIEHDCDKLEGRNDNLTLKYKNVDNTEKSDVTSTHAVSDFSDVEIQENIHKTVPVVNKDGKENCDNPERPHHF